MNFTEFVLHMQAEVKEKVSPEVSVEVHTSRKNNGRQRTGLVLSRQGINMSPTIYMEEFYEQYLDGASIENLAHKIRRLYEKVKVRHSYPFENILSYQKVKNRIVYKVIQREANEELLRDMPYEEYLNLAVVYYVILEQTPFGTATVQVENKHLKLWGVSAAEIAAAARENTPRLLIPEVIQLTDFLYIVTNRTGNFGAAVMLYPELWKKIRNVLGENFYILPSSVHEVLLVRESYGMKRTQLEIMVKEINETEVDEEEVLADTVYYYCGKEERVVI